MLIEENCSTCRFSKSYGGGKYRLKDGREQHYPMYVFCRRYPVHVEIKESPDVHWCGEWKRQGLLERGE